MLKVGKNSGYTRPTLFVGWGEELGPCDLENAQKCESVPRGLCMIVDTDASEIFEEEK